MQKPIARENSTYIDDVVAIIRRGSPEPLQPEERNANLPQALTSLQRWCRYNPKSKMPTVPQKSGRFEGKGWNNPSTWLTFDDPRINEHIYIGWMFSADDDIFGIDIDGCFDGDGKLIAPAQQLVDKFGDRAYIEYSMSGGGLHLFPRGKLPEGFKTEIHVDGLNLEIYNSGRHFAMTGKRIRGDVQEAQDAVDWLLSTYPDIAGNVKKPAAPKPKAEHKNMSDDTYPIRALGKSDPAPYLQTVTHPTDGALTFTKTNSQGRDEWGAHDGNTVRTRITVKRTGSGNHTVVVFSTSIDAPEHGPGSYDFARFYCHRELGVDIQNKDPKSKEMMDVCKALAAKGFGTWDDRDPKPPSKGKQPEDFHRESVAGNVVQMDGSTRKGPSAQERMDNKAGELFKNKTPIPAARKALHTLNAKWNAELSDEAIDELIKKHYPRLETMSAGDIWDAEFPELRFVVPGMVPDGLTILAGQPKIGKSFMALGIAMGAAGGKNVLGDREVDEPMGVLYAALEDPPARLQSRMKTVLREESASAEMRANLHFLPQGKMPAVMDKYGISLLDEFIAGKDIRLVIIDTWQRVRPTEGRRSSGTLYEEDYELLGNLQSWAQNKGIAVIVIHHLRKTADEDYVFNQISGSVGIQAAVDSLMMIVRHKGDLILETLGRDFEGERLKMNFSDGVWGIQGEAANDPGQGLGKDIIDVLTETEESMGPKAIAETLGENPNDVRKSLGQLLKRGLIIKTGYGKYTVDLEDTRHTRHTEDTRHTRHTEDSVQGNTSMVHSEATPHADPGRVCQVFQEPPKTAVSDETIKEPPEEETQGTPAEPATELEQSIVDSIRTTGNMYQVIDTIDAPADDILDVVERWEMQGLVVVDAETDRVELSS